MSSELTHYTKEQAIEDLQSLKEYFMEQTEGSAPMCLDYAIEALKNTQYDEDCRVLKKRAGEYVTYRVDYLLDNLAREIYLLEALRKWKETNHDDA